MNDPSEKKKNDRHMKIQNNIQELLRQVNNGSITIVKQNNTVVQINLVEKLKLV